MLPEPLPRLLSAFQQHRGLPQQAKQQQFHQGRRVQPTARPAAGTLEPLAPPLPMAGQGHRHTGPGGGHRPAAGRQRWDQVVLVMRATLSLGLGVRRLLLAATPRHRALLGPGTGHRCRPRRVARPQSLSRCSRLPGEWRMPPQLVTKMARGAAEAGAGGTEVGTAIRIGNTEAGAERGVGAVEAGVEVAMVEEAVAAVVRASSDEPWHGPCCCRNGFAARVRLQRHCHGLVTLDS
mmetsp:Transcript_133158/g.259246  ORF Transcript_133158/g.259246 Transcript_133158/m.259246 type:complete len:236 (-) Transcript_133158:74-781(-)